MKRNKKKQKKTPLLVNVSLSRYLYATVMMCAHFY